MIGIALAVCIVLTIVLIRRYQRLTTMGRDLRPVCSWSTPFRSAGRMPRSFFSLYFAVWFGGLILLNVFYWH
jgi:hypothetical protein